MSKKFILFIVVFVISLFTVSYTFAANNAVDNVRNAVGGAENVIEKFIHIIELIYLWNQIPKFQDLYCHDTSYDDT